MDASLPRALVPSPGRLRSALTVVMFGAALAGCVVAPPRPVVREAPRSVPPPAAPAMYFYPLRGQGEGQLDRDRYECYRWAVQQTGFDPGMTPVRETRPPRPTAGPPPVPPGADVAAGAVTGAAVGAAVSSPRHAGEGAVLGAIFGAVLGAAAAEARGAEQARAQAEAARAREAAQAQARRPLDDFRRAMTACMDGRGYAVQ